MNTVIDLDVCLTWGCGDYVDYGGESVRVRYVVADTMDAYAKELQSDRPDVAGLMRSISGDIRHGSIPSKKSRGKARKHLDVIRARLSAL